MHSSRYILNIGLGIGIVSVLYFISLLGHLPIWGTAVLIAIALYYLVRWNRPFSYEEQERVGSIRFFVLVIGVAVLTNKAYHVATKHGVWDAWAMWNLHAVYLMHPAEWKNMFLNTTYGHPDYPLALPATLAFFGRLIGQWNVLMPFAFHFLVMLCIPVLIYLETYKRNILMAILALYWFVTNEYYLTLGTYQTADTLLAFFFLCATVCMDWKEDPRMVAMSAAFLGLCMWTKNEGVILAAIFVLFHLKELFSADRVWYTLKGIAIPLAAWLLFKLAFAPPNDMIQGQGKSTQAFLLDKSRYQLVYDNFVKNLNQHFKWVKWGALVYAVLCAFRWSRPDKRFLMVLTCMFAYFMVYIVSPNDLEWHLSTSMNRLMHQLTPVMIYVLAVLFCGNANGSFRARFVSARRHLR